MTHWTRLTYSAALCAVLVSIFILLSAIFVPSALSEFLKYPYWVGMFAISYLIAPWVGRYIHRE